jgi:hypothetical protein
MWKNGRIYYPKWILKTTLLKRKEASESNRSFCLLAYLLHNLCLWCTYGDKCGRLNNYDNIRCLRLVITHEMQSKDRGLSFELRGSVNPTCYNPAPTFGQANTSHDEADFFLTNTSTAHVWNAACPATIGLFHAFVFLPPRSCAHASNMPHETSPPSRISQITFLKEQHIYCREKKRV